MHDKIQKWIFQGRYSKKNQLIPNCKTWKSHVIISRQKIYLQTKRPFFSFLRSKRIITKYKYRHWNHLHPLKLESVLQHGDIATGEWPKQKSSDVRPDKYICKEMERLIKIICPKRFSLFLENLFNYPVFKIRRWPCLLDFQNLYTTLTNMFLI